jgi:hypothetical protein
VIRVSHRAVLNLVKARDHAVKMTPDDVVVGWVAFYHDLGLVGSLLAPLLSGVTSVDLDVLLAAASRVFDGSDSSRSRHRLRDAELAFIYCAKRVQDGDMQGFDLSH